MMERVPPASSEAMSYDLCTTHNLCSIAYIQLPLMLKRNRFI